MLKLWNKAKGPQARYETLQLKKKKVFLSKPKCILYRSGSFFKALLPAI